MGIGLCESVAVRKQYVSTCRKERETKRGRQKKKRLREREKEKERKGERGKIGYNER